MWAPSSGSTTLREGTRNEEVIMAAERPFTITGIDRSDYMAKDPARAIAFYRDVLGLELQSLAPDNSSGEFELPDGSTFGLWVGSDAVMPFQPSNGVLFAVDDLEAAVSALEARGIAIITRLETPVCFMALINDTEGNVITLHKRKTAIANPPAGFPRIVPHLIYEDVGAAIEVLTTTFGFQERPSARHVSADGTIGRTQMQVADSVITLGQPSIHGDSPRRGVSSMLYIYVDDVDSHFRRARSAAATIVTEVETMPWGDRRYQATDPEGHQWTFAQHVFPADPVDDHH
jgi:uncharacterized glyoxalase superfamily protein PhnB